MKKSLLIASMALLPAGFHTATAEEFTTASDFISKGDLGLKLRYRLEWVDQDGFARNAAASTLLSTVYYKSPTLNGFSGYAEVTNITTLGAESFNDTVNGRTQFPVVPDPEVTEFNQGYLAYKSDTVAAHIGRKAVNIADQRFIGSVGWRQNDQTFDGASLSFSPTDALSASYNYVWSVNRIFGRNNPNGEFAANHHLINADYAGPAGWKVSAYGYFLDFGDPAPLRFSSQTIGVRLDGGTDLSETVRVNFGAEYANQQDYRDNPTSFSANFLRASVTGKTGDFSLKGSYEKLGSDNGVGFSTPLATLHKFNGWADLFLATPAQGLQDFNISAGYKIPGNSIFAGTNLRAIYHEFRSDVGDQRYGSEWDFLLTKKLNSTVSLLMKAAFYNRDTFGRDTNRFWFQLAASF